MVLLVTLFTYSKGVYILCQVCCYLFTFALLRKGFLNFVHFVNVGNGKDKNCLYEWNWCITDDCTSGGRLLDLFRGLLWDLTEIGSVGSTLPNLLILNLLELLHSCLGEAVRVWNCTSCYLGKSKKCQVRSGLHPVSWTLATDGQKVLAELILSDPRSSLAIPCSGVLDAE